MRSRSLLREASPRATEPNTMTLSKSCLLKIGRKRSDRSSSRFCPWEPTPRESAEISTVQIKIKAGRNNYRPQDYDLDDDICFHDRIIPEAGRFSKRKKLCALGSDAAARERETTALSIGLPAVCVALRLAEMDLETGPKMAER